MRSSGKHVLLANTQSPSDQSYSKNDPANTLAFCVPRPVHKKTTQTHTQSCAPAKNHRRGRSSAGKKGVIPLRKILPHDLRIAIACPSNIPTKYRLITSLGGDQSCIPNVVLLYYGTTSVCVGGLHFLSALWPFYRQLEAMNVYEYGTRRISVSDFQGRIVCC